MFIATKVTAIGGDQKCEACGFAAVNTRTCCVCGIDAPLCNDCAESLVALNTKAYICVFDRRVQGHGSIEARPDVDAIVEAEDADEEETETQELEVKEDV